MIVFQNRIFKLTCMMMMLKWKANNAKPAETRQLKNHQIYGRLMPIRLTIYV